MTVMMSQRKKNALLQLTPVNNRIRKAQISSKHQKLTIIQTYTPTNETDGDEKQDFFNQMHNVLHGAIRMT